MEKDVLSETNIQKYLNNSHKYTILYYDKIDSTNTFLKNNAEKYEKSTIVVASEQTKGRGRFGKSFFSPQNTGVYGSLLFRPKIEPDKTLKVTTAAAVAACFAIKSVFGKNPKIKWVNDIFLDDKKVCGILAESAFDEKGEVKHVILGAGFNVYKPKEGFPNEIKSSAGFILENEREEAKSKLIAEFFNYFEILFEQDIIDKYREFCFVPGENIEIISNETKKSAKAILIDENFRLLVEYENGKSEYLSSGEISIKLK